jgi:septal ring factor EnvC (AmiA/AmiB activator)
MKIGTNNSLFGLTTASALDEKHRECEQLKCSLHLAENLAQKWKANFFENNETIERLQQLLNASEAENLEIKAKLNTRNIKIECLIQDLAESKIWAKTLEGTNREQAEKLGKQVDAINNALNESAQTSLLYNQATVDIAALKLANKRYQEAVKIAADNFILSITN